MPEKTLADAYTLGIPFGLFGAHHFYLGRKEVGIVYACTFGLLGLGYIFDLFRMKWLVEHANRRGKDTVMVSDVWLIGLIGGIFGAHHFYLGNRKLGILYACTFGVFTMGWITDLTRMKYLVKAYKNHNEERSLGTAYILAFPPLGIFGAYHYYLNNVRLGLVYTFTFGIFGIGWIVDLFLMNKLVQKAGQDKKSLLRAHIMAMSPFGLFGAHHYYLGNYMLGVMYTCTLGIFTIGWITDWFRVSNLVQASNDPTSDFGTTKVNAYIMCVSPLGIFGAHHFYLKRYFNGGVYAATFGVCGIGWLFDMFRLPVLYERYADEDKHKYPDEAYLYWFPFGLFGLHHFYLENNNWGLLYACTLGCFGFGWLIDGIQLPTLLNEYNKNVESLDKNNFRICMPSSRCCSMNKCKQCFYDSFSCGWFDIFINSRSRPRDNFDGIGEMNTEEKYYDAYAYPPPSDNNKNADSNQELYQAHTNDDNYTYPPPIDNNKNADSNQELYQAHTNDDNYTNEDNYN